MSLRCHFWLRNECILISIIGATWVAHLGRLGRALGTRFPFDSTSMSPRAPSDLLDFNNLDFTPSARSISFRCHLEVKSTCLRCHFEITLVSRSGSLRPNFDVFRISYEFTSMPLRLRVGITSALSAGWPIMPLTSRRINEPRMLSSSEKPLIDRRCPSLTEQNNY